MAECCVVIYPAARAGEVSYLYGVFETEAAARDHYFQEPEPEGSQPQFLVVPLYPASSDHERSTDG